MNALTDSHWLQLPNRVRLLYPLIPAQTESNHYCTWQQHIFFNRVKIYRCLISGHKTGHIFNGGRFRGDSNKIGSWCLWPIYLWKRTFSESRARSFFIGTWARNTMNWLYLNPPAAQKVAPDFPPTVLYVRVQIVQIVQIVRWSSIHVCTV